MPAQTQPPDRYTHALVTLQSLYETYLSSTLPPPINTLITTVLHYLIQIQPLVSQLFTLLTGLIATLTGASAGSAQSTALLSTAVTALALYVSLRVMNYMRRMVMGWVIFAIKVVFVLVMVQVVIYVNRYGWENAIRDASWWGGIVWGFVEEVLEGNTGTGNGARQAPRGTRSRASTRRGAQYGQQGRGQVPVGGRARWT